MIFFNSGTYPSPFLQRLISGANCCARRILLITEMDLDTKFVVKLHLRPEIRATEVAPAQIFESLCPNFWADYAKKFGISAQMPKPHWGTQKELR